MLSDSDWVRCCPDVEELSHLQEPSLCALSLWLLVTIIVTLLLYGVERASKCCYHFNEQAVAPYVRLNKMDF